MRIPIVEGTCSFCESGKSNWKSSKDGTKQRTRNTFVILANSDFDRHAALDDQYMHVSKLAQIMRTQVNNIWAYYIVTSDCRRLLRFLAFVCIPLISIERSEHRCHAKDSTT
uniref:Uncharacterized protein n=1 Tax=Ascaris lumbricoides TaxID=6252 RepID=A0A0M3HSH9_ASCLU